MIRTLPAVALVLLATPVAANEPVAEADMPGFCIGMAAAVFGEKPQAIAVTDTRTRPSGAFRVLGCTVGEQRARWTCTAHPDGSTGDIMFLGEG